MLSTTKNQTTNAISHRDRYSGRVGLVYARVSSKRQETEGTGLQSQEGRCLHELQILDIPHEQTFLDSYTGDGDFMKRPAMRKLLAYVDKHPHKKFVVVFDDLKRFARNVEFHFKLKMAFKTRDVELRCLNYNFDESDEGWFAELITAAQAELERRQNRRQVIQKQKARLERGYWPFGSKRGYKQTPDKTHGMISLATTEGLTVLKSAMEKFASGELVRKIDVCRFLVEKKFWKKQSPEKYIDKVTLILQDPFYGGFIEYPSWDVSIRKGQHEGLVSPQVFELIQKRLKNESLGKRIRTDISEEFPLRGLTKCGECGEHITSSKAKGKYPYYFCQNKECGSKKKAIRKSDMERDFKKLLKQTRLRDNLARVVEVLFDRVWKDEIRALEREKTTRGHEISLREEKIAQLTEAAIKAKSERVRESYETQIEKESTELSELRRQPDITRIDLTTPYRTALVKVTTLLKNPYSVWKKLNVIEQHQLFYFIFEQKLPYHINEGYRTNEIRSYIGLFEEFVSTKTQDVEMPGNLSNQVKDYLSRFWSYYQSTDTLQKVLN